MAEKDKVTTLNDEIVQAQHQRKEVDAKVSTLNTTISDLTKKETRLTGERASLRQDFDTLKERPHENLDQILTTQNGMAAKDVEIAKTQDDLEKASGQYRAAFTERAGLDNKIDGLEDKAVRTLNIEEFKSNVGEKFEQLKSTVSERLTNGVEHLKEHAVPIAMGVAGAAATYHDVHEALPHLEVMTNTIAGELLTRAVEHKDALMETVNTKVTEYTEGAGSSPDHVERKNLEAEIAKHNDHADELDTLTQNFKRALDQPGPVDVSEQPKDVRVREEFESVVDKANRLFEQQDKEMAEIQVDNATDPAVRTTEAQVRETMAEETIRDRDKVTRELCQPVAELNVDERNARTLEDSAGLNKAHLERYGMKVANEPDGQTKVDKFASNLEQSQKDLQQQLVAERPEAIEKEVTSLQGQHFPEVQAQAQALQGPGLQQAGPQQEGPAGPGQ